MSSSLKEISKEYFPLRTHTSIYSSWNRDTTTDYSMPGKRNTAPTEKKVSLQSFKLLNSRKWNIFFLRHQTIEELVREKGPSESGAVIALKKGKRPQRFRCVFLFLIWNCIHWYINIFHPDLSHNAKGEKFRAGYTAIGVLAMSQ